MITCIVIEDQLPARRILQKYIADAGHLELVEIFPNALDALEYLRDHKVDLLFLDIHLPRLSGIDFLAVLKDQPYVILTTAFPFESQDQARGFFNDLRQLFIDWNYMEWEGEDFKKQQAAIETLIAEKSGSATSD